MDSAVAGGIHLTAFYVKGRYGYVGFVAELPGVSAQGSTLDQARENLVRLAAVVVEEERREAEALIAGRDVVRESFVVRALGL